MPDREWRTLGGKRIENFLDEVVKSTISNSRVVHVGCDSQQHGLFTDFVTVVVLLDPGKGGRVLWTKERVDRISVLRTRLLREVELSVNTSFKLSGVLSEDVDLNVHIDVNPNIKFKSSKFVKELVGYVQGCGFSALTKPDSFVAMHVADHIVKNKNNRDISAKRSRKSKE